MKITDILGITWLQNLLASMDDWQPDGEGSVEADGEADRSPAPEGVETKLEPAPGDGSTTEAKPVFTPPVINLEEKAKGVRYRIRKNGRMVMEGKVKRTKYRKRKLRDVKTAVVHQVGAERKASSSRWIYITANSVIRTDGARLRLFPLWCRLICSNGFDRRPHHAVGIEVGGNFEGEDGRGNWYEPKKFGRGRASLHQLIGLAFELAGIHAELQEAGGGLELIAPHRVSGQRKGKPNRPLCPGSRLWQAAEHVAWRLGVPVPAGGWKLGGTPIPVSWRTRRWLEANGYDVEALIETDEWRPAVSDDELAALDDAIVRATA